MPRPQPLRTAVATVVALVLALTGAIAAGAQQGGVPRVTVAVLDSFTNPYHEWFNQGGPLYPDAGPSAVTPAVLAEFGVPAENVIELTRTGDFEADFAADEAQFDAIERGEPYWFAGTNIIGISFEDSDQLLRPDGTASTHGIGTTGSVAAGNPEAIIVSVEGTIPEAETWAMTHPAVDLVSTSYGIPGSPPLGSHLTDSYVGVVENGKHHFGAADNSPAVSDFDSTSGPWWTIGIAGFQEGEGEGRQLLSGTLPDFVGDFTQDLPYCRSCEGDYDNPSGTSFATPLSAGTFSKVLLEARRAADHTGGIVTEGVDRPLMVSGNGIALTNWDLRRAFEEAAYYPTLAEYEAADPTAAPPVDGAPHLTFSWGAITPDPEHGVVAETLAHAGIRGEPTRTKSAATCDFLTANIDARHAYWDTSLQSQSFGTTDDPYRYCGEDAPSEEPSEGGSEGPSESESEQPSESPSDSPSEERPSEQPSERPSEGGASSGSQPGGNAGPREGVSRLDGSGRVAEASGGSGTDTSPAAVRATAIDVSRYGFRTDAAGAVLLGRDDVFADSLAGAPLAGDDAAVLFTPGGPDAALDPQVRAEIDRLLSPGAPVRILGGEQAVSAAVATELADAGYAVERIAGETRFETASQLADVVVRERGATDEAVLASAYSWPDAITAGAWGAATGTPVLLTDVAALHPAAAAAFDRHGTARTHVAGGTAVVSEAAAASAPGADRVAGATRMGTAVEVADRLWAPTLGGQPQAVVVVNLFADTGWALALSAAPLSAAMDAPQLGVAVDEIPAETAAYLDRAVFEGVPPVVVVGNLGFVSSAVAEELDAAVSG